MEWRRSWSYKRFLLIIEELKDFQISPPNIFRKSAFGRSFCRLESCPAESCRRGESLWRQKSCWTDSGLDGSDRAGPWKKVHWILQLTIGIGYCLNHCPTSYSSLFVIKLYDWLYYWLHNNKKKIFEKNVKPNGASRDVLEPLECRPVGQEVERVTQEQRLRIRNGLNLEIN